MLSPDGSDVLVEHDVRQTDEAVEDAGVSERTIEGVDTKMELAMLAQ